MMRKAMPSPPVNRGPNPNLAQAWTRRLAAWLDQWRPYAADDPDAASFRARQLQALLHLTPLAMAVNVANAGVICLVTWTQVSHAFLMAWTAAIRIPKV